MQPWIDFLQTTWREQVEAQEALQHRFAMFDMPWQDPAVLQAQALLWQQLWAAVQANLSLWSAWWPGPGLAGSLAGIAGPALCAQESPASARARRTPAPEVRDAAPPSGAPAAAAKPRSGGKAGTTSAPRRRPVARRSR
jgi:hypothetical protein